MSERSYTVEELKELGLVGQKHDVFAPVNQAQSPHGWNQFDPTTGGLFTRPGASGPVYSAMRGMSDSLLAYIIARNGLRGSVETNPEYEILTGVRGVQGVMGEDCGDAQYAGFAKAGTWRAAFGKFRAKTERVQLTEVGSRINAGDIDRDFVNLPRFAPFVPEVARNTRNLNTMLGMQLFRLGVATERAMSPVVYSGVAGAQSDFFPSQFDGLDVLIRTGYINIANGAPMPAADSIVVNRGSVPVSTDPPSIVTQISGIWRALQRRAQSTGLAPLELVIAMHPDLFEALALLWPLSYYTEGAANATDAMPVLNTGREITDIRYDMLQNSYLPIRGSRVNVILDDSIEITQSGNGFDSDIYFVPVTALGTPVTYFEHFDMNNAQIQEYRELAGDEWRVMNSGLYFTTKQRTVECLEYFFIAKPRLILRTPWLAGRLTNVNFALPGTYDYTESPFVNGAYHVNGGAYLNSTSLPYVSPDSE